MVIENLHDGGDRSLKLFGRTALFTLFLVGLTLSVVFPYGIGFAAFLGAIALVGAVGGVGARLKPPHFVCPVENTALLGSVRDEERRQLPLDTSDRR